MIKQFVPQEFCLKCRGCCRFKEANSVWSPCLLDEEIQGFLDKEGIPAISISADRRIQPIAIHDEKGFVCPLLNTADNKCRIYNLRPFECRLYPFLINLRSTRPYRIGRYALPRRNKVLLTVDINCPYAFEKINSQEAKDYIAYLSDFFNSPEQLAMLKDNPQIIQAYEDLREVTELKLPHEIK